jgi:hypothetical protein
MGGILAFLGVDPLSLIGKFLGSLLLILPYLLVAGLIVGAYFYGSHNGTALCNAKQLQNIIDVQKKQIADYQNELHDQEITIAALQATIAVDDQAIADAKKKLPAIIVSGPGCDQPGTIIDLFNGVRK